MEENKTMTISKLKNHYGGHMQTAITQKDLEYLSKTLHTAYTYVHKQCVKISCNLEMVTWKTFGHLAHFKWNDPQLTTSHQKYWHAQVPTYCQSVL